MTNELHIRWHGFPVSCLEEYCEVCDCDCDHCCFGIGRRCFDHEVVKTCQYPVDGRTQKISKTMLDVSERELHHLDMLFRLAQSPKKNLHAMRTLLEQFPQFEFMSDDAGKTVLDLIRMHPSSQDILDTLL